MSKYLPPFTAGARVDGAQELGSPAAPRDPVDAVSAQASVSPSVVAEPEVTYADFLGDEVEDD